MYKKVQQANKVMFILIILGTIIFIACVALVGWASLQRICIYMSSEHIHTFQ